ncbi:DNA-binding response regulator [Sphaerisporangium krabiense]|uniref:DNA-binding NarL/FixJ family response regulator n=1 Tax=Sphaerisporangium krabiense TaxID=763782 RepID=A0A7W9DR08_9ACTN|nr:response regulator transcription factor [Sphaerisporangium krabiense]MBB5628041.1 DNA-binding NarL/FixJ family response regulator [Sphaerisporangium krabiense]GII62206.1 DNA-binding response regulator [Sphaerisporangium krabiense]
MREEHGRIKISLLSGDPLFREGLSGLLVREPDFDVVEHSENGCRESEPEVCPDVVILVAESRDPLCCDTVRRLCGTPSLRVLVLSSCDDSCFMRQLLEAGVQAYLCTSVHRELLVSAIRAIMADRSQVVVFSRRLTFGDLLRGPGGEEVLTQREGEVLRLAAEGLSNSAIAVKLFISKGTVKRHLTNIYTKLDVASRVHAINKATQLRLIEERRTEPRHQIT